MNITPLLDRVVLKPVEKDSVTKSWIILPDGANKQRPFIYEVVSVWPGKPDSDMSAISTWDKVLCGQYAWDEVTLWDETYKIVAMEYILGKVS